MSDPSQPVLGKDKIEEIDIKLRCYFLKCDDKFSGAFSIKLFKDFGEIVGV